VSQKIEGNENTLLRNKQRDSLPYCKTNSNTGANQRRKQMAEAQPIVGRTLISPARERWLRTEIKEGLCRCTAIAKAVSMTKRPTKPKQTVWDGYYQMEKLHDREPQLVSQTLIKKWPNFWDGFPVRGENTTKKQHEFIGEWCKAYIHHGISSYGKPKLRRQPK
jgi:hypothetical protein